MLLQAGESREGYRKKYCYKIPKLPNILLVIYKIQIYKFNTN